MKRNISFKIQIIVEPDRVDGWFHAYSPTLVGLHEYGDTEQEALQKAKNFAIAYIKSLIKDNEPIRPYNKRR